MPGGQRVEPGVQVGAAAVLSVLACLLAAFITPSAHAAATYDITQVGDAKFVSVTDTNGKELSGLTTGSNAFNVKATICLRIDDIGALRQGDAVQVGATAADKSHYAPYLFTDTNLPSFLTDKQGRNVFSVKYVDPASFSLTRTGTEEQGSYICDLTVANTLWNWWGSSTSSTWRIGKSSTYTFSSQQSRNSPCTQNGNGMLTPSVNGNRIDVGTWFLNCATMTAVANGRDTSGFRKDSQIGWAHVTPQTGEIKGMTVGNHAIFILQAIDGRTPGRDGSIFPGRTWTYPLMKGPLRTCLWDPSRPCGRMMVHGISPTTSVPGFQGWPIP